MPARLLFRVGLLDLEVVLIATTEAVSAGVEPASSTEVAELSDWFKARPVWLQDAARRLLETGKVSPVDLPQLTALCKKEAGIDTEETRGVVAVPLHGGAFAKAPPAHTLILDSLADIKGVNALAPRKPLLFGPQLTVVYGSNASGKSGYMRILKHICGARAKGQLLGNVFSATQDPKSCTVHYTIDGKEKVLPWVPADGVVDDLRAVAIYDTECADVYVNEENEVAYEPEVLAFFRDLVAVCDSVGALINEEISRSGTTLPAIPPEYLVTNSATWMKQVHRLIPPAEIDAHCQWSEALEQALVSLMQRLSTPDPAVTAASTRKTAAHLAKLAGLIVGLRSQLDDTSFIKLKATRMDAQVKRRAADADAARVFENAPLAGVASESWRLLWEKARIYSETEVYRGVKFPNTEREARCVLCQQPLDDEAVLRFQGFEAFVRGALGREASEAEERLANTIAAIGQVPVTSEIDALLDLGAVSNEETRKSLEAYCGNLRKRRDTFVTATEIAELQPLPDTNVPDSLAALVAARQKEASLLEQDAKTDQRAQIRKDIAELSARKWLSEGKNLIAAEVARLQHVHLLREADRLTNTKVLSEKKSALAEVIVTAAFRSRLDQELRLLGGSRIGATIEKTKTTKGQVWHKVQLPDCKTAAKVAEILSEGEFRVVSIGAFLADVEAKGGHTPFLFDDPVSSLDQDYEEATAARLAQLSASRQVIVFTHRLSLLAMLGEAGKVAGVEVRVVAIRQEPWGTGEPEGLPLFAQKPKQALNTLSGERLPKAKKVLGEAGKEAYSVDAKAMCSDIRITIERMIENDLLADVVQRFRRPINTLGKIERLARIKRSDCDFLDSMMTKYSRYEHSQPGEAPVALPEPAEFDQDLSKLIAWLDEFSGRAVPAP